MIINRLYYFYYYFLLFMTEKKEKNERKEKINLYRESNKRVFPSCVMIMDLTDTLCRFDNLA